MPKQNKKTSTKLTTRKTVKKTTRPQKAINTNRLKTWLFDKPVMFALLTFLLNFITGIAYAIVAGIFATQIIWPLIILLTGVFCWTTYYLIKKLPHDTMHRNDFIAITNGCCLISVLIPLISILFLGNDVQLIKYKFMVLYFWHPSIVWLLAIFFILLYLYLLGVAISGVYAKYKRAIELGISKWKVILSMPFAFLLMWTPGYLIPEKKSESNLTIKSKWFNKFNKWVIADKTNTLLVFIVLVLLRNMFAGMPTLLLTVFLLAIYTLWVLKHKTSFLKNINNGYALTAIAINISAIVVVIYSIFALGANPY